MSSHLNRHFQRAAGTVGVAAGLLLAGCPDAPGSMGTGTADLASPAAVDLGCYAQPQTHIELLNACTSAQSIAKQPVLPLRRSDGSLPPLP